MGWHEESAPTTSGVALFAAAMCKERSPNLLFFSTPSGFARRSASTTSKGACFAAARCRGIRPLLFSTAAASG